MCIGSNSSALSVAKDDLQSNRLKKLQAMIDSDVATDEQKKEYAELLNKATPSMK